jgi:hypothetical protein
MDWTCTFEKAMVLTELPVMVRPRLPPRHEVAPDTPLRLLIAATVAFPDGSMTASGLRREAAEHVARPPG